MNFNKKQLITFGVGVSLLLSTVVTATPVSAAVQTPADKVFATQVNTGKNSEGNCSPATAKMVLNAYGLGTNVTVQDISEKYGGLGNGGEVLAKFGIMQKDLNNDDSLAKKYLDSGVVLSVGIYNGVGPHTGVALDYRTSNGYLEYYVLDPSKLDAEPYWAAKQDGSSTIGNISISCAWLYNKLEKITVEDTAKDGHKYTTDIFYDKERQGFYYSKDADKEYAGNATASYKDAVSFYNRHANDNIFNTQDIVYAKEQNSPYVMINGNAYSTLTKDFVSKTWGIVR